jgi:hypothetical protein
MHLLLFHRYSRVRNGFFRLLVLLIAWPGLISCGGGGSTDSGGAGVRLQGAFIDSAVEGLSYTAGKEKGVTDASGHYYYVAEGDPVTFSIGSIQLPIVKAAKIVTPLAMSSSADIADPVVANVAFLLQALDSDGNPSNGISITQATTAAATKALDFNMDPAEFSQNEYVLALIKTVSDNPGSGVTTDSSASHLAESLRGLLDSNRVTIGPTGCQSATTEYTQRTSLSTQLWANMYAMPKGNWFYTGDYIYRLSSPRGDLVQYTPAANSIEVRTAKLSSDWDDRFSMTQDKWFKHVNNEYVVLRIAAKQNASETTYLPQYSGGSLHLHYTNPLGGALQIELGVGSEVTAFFSFTGNNAGTIIKTPVDYPMAFMHYGGTTPDGRYLGSSPCVIKAGGSVLLWRRPSGRSDLFYSPEFKTNLQGREMPVYESGKGYAVSAGIRTGVRSLTVLY